MYTLRTGTATLVLNSKYSDVDISPIAPLIALFLCPTPTWERAISKLHTDQSSLHDVRYLHANHVRERDFRGKPNANPHCTNYHTTMEEAAKLGFLSVVNYLHTNSLKGCGKYAMDRAAKYGHFHVVQWLHEHRKEGCSDKAMARASKNGHLEVVRFLHEVVHRGTLPVSYMVWKKALSHGHLPFVQYLLDQMVVGLRNETQAVHPEWTSEAVEEAVQVEVVKWVQGDGSGANRENVVQLAAWKGFTEMVAFLFSKGFAGDCAKAIFNAACHGHLDIVRFFHDKKSDGFTANTTECASERGHLDIVQYLHENCTEGCTANAMDQAANYGHLDIVQYLHQNRTEGCTVKAMDKAAKYGHLDIVQFLHDNRTEGCTVKAMNQAAAGGYLDVVQYLHVHRTEGCTSEAVTQAALKGDLDIVQFLRDNRPESIDPEDKYTTNDAATLSYLHAHQLVELDPENFCSPDCSLEMLEFLYDHCVVQMGEEDRLSFVHAALENIMRLVDRFRYVGRDRPLDLARIQYLDSKRPVGDLFESKAMDIAAARGNLNGLRYLHTQGGHGGCTKAAMNHAAFAGHLDIIQFLNEHQSEGCTTAAMDEAARNGRLDIVQVLHQHRSEGCTKAAMAKKRGAQRAFGYCQIPTCSPIRRMYHASDGRRCQYWSSGYCPVFA